MKELKKIKFIMRKGDSDGDALFIAGIYGFFGIAWIALSDKLLSLIIEDSNIYKQMQTYKGWLYVAITIALIYILVRNRTRLIMNSNIKLSQTYQELAATEEELKDQIEVNNNIFMDAHVIIGTWNEEGRITKLNPFALELFGYTEAEVINKRWLDVLISEENKSIMVNDFKRISQGKQLRNHESQFITKDNKKIDIIWNHTIMNFHNKPSEVLSIGTDITSQKSLEKKLKVMAYYDSLTGLPNRRLLEDEVNKIIKEKVPFAMVYIDIDNFRQINDTLGHNIGDQFLQYIGNKLYRSIQSTSSIVARFGGDQFAFLLKGYSTKIEVEKALDVMLHEIGKSWEIKHHEFYITFSMGVSLFPKDGEDHHTLFRNADIAMNRAKVEGRGRCIFYSEEISINNTENVQLANQLKYAIKYRELILYYQPQYNLNTEEITGFEALVRWKHPERGFIPPAKFIPIAEETGQIYEIEKWIIGTALNQKRKFEQAGRMDLSISINLSGKALASEMNFQAVEEVFDSYQVDYSNITIEITETAIISDIQSAVRRLKRLKEFGVKIALDDFGTGFSSLTYLKDLPIDIVKLDRSFVNSIKENSKDAMIIKAILYLALDLKYEVVAEGIETNEQLDYLKKYRCESGQGYLMSKPIPIEEVEEKLGIKK